MELIELSHALALPLGTIKTTIINKQQTNHQTGRTKGCFIRDVTSVGLGGGEKVKPPKKIKTPGFIIGSAYRIFTVLGLKPLPPPPPFAFVETQLVSTFGIV